MVRAHELQAGEAESSPPLNCEASCKVANMVPTSLRESVGCSLACCRAESAGTKDCQRSTYAGIKDPTCKTLQEIRGPLAC